MRSGNSLHFFPTDHFNSKNNQGIEIYDMIYDEFSQIYIYIYSKYKQIPQFLDLSPHFPLKWLFGWYTPHFQTDPDIIWLVVWNVFYFSHHIENVIIPTDFHILFRGVGMPPTRSLLYLYHIKSHWTIMFLGEITPFSGRPRHHMMKSHELNHH